MLSSILLYLFNILYLFTSWSIFCLWIWTGLTITALKPTCFGEQKLFFFPQLYKFIVVGLLNCMATVGLTLQRTVKTVSQSYCYIILHLHFSVWELYTFLCVPTRYCQVFFFFLLFAILISVSRIILWL